MTFAGINYLSILAAAVAGWLAGAAWYMLLAKPWMAAVGIGLDEMEAARARPGGWLPFLFAFLACVVMAWVLAGLMGHIGRVSVRSGVISGAFCWAGFVVTTMLVNYSFAMRRWLLLVIDAGHWLLVLALMGAVIGAIGV
jgi:uncharacterized protein DUF1761